MKIAFIANTSWNIYNFRKGLVQYFLDRGDQVIVISPHDEYTEAIKQWGVKHCSVFLDQTGTNPVKDLQYLMRLSKIFRKERPHVALSFTIKSNIYSCIAGRLLRVPTICNVSGLGTVFLVKGWLGGFAIRLYRFAFRYASYVFFQNKDDRELFLTHISVKSKRIGLLPGSGINLDAFPYQEMIPSNPSKFLMIARIIEEKGVRDYVKAAKLLKEQKIPATFTLIGKHDEAHSRSIPKSELDSWISEGLVDYYAHSSDIVGHILNHQVVVLPSYREGTPRTLLEGAALGRVLMASNVPGCKEVVEDGVNGFLFEVKNPASLADKIRLYHALGDKERQTLARNSRKIAESRFDEKLVIGKYVDTISQIVDN